MKHRHSGKYRSKTPKGRIVHKKRPKHKHHLSKRNRSIFQKMDKEDYEVGGYMDFDRKGLERADVYPGRKGSVDIVITPDKEVDYHTHPSTRDIKDKLNYFPSKADIRSSSDLPTQASLIFHKGNLTIAKKMSNYRPTEKQMDKIERGLNKDAKKMSTTQLMNKYQPEYKKMGIELKHIKHKKGVTLPIKIKEPINKRKVTKSVSFFPETAEPGEINILDASVEEVREQARRDREAQAEEQAQRRREEIAREREKAKEEFARIATEKAKEENRERLERQREEAKDIEFTSYGEEEDPWKVEFFRRR